MPVAMITYPFWGHCCMDVLYLGHSKEIRLSAPHNCASTHFGKDMLLVWIDSEIPDAARLGKSVKLFLPSSPQ